MHVTYSENRKKIARGTRYDYQWVKYLVNDCSMLTLGFSNYMLQQHFVVVLIKQMCILGSDFLKQWDAKMISKQDC